MNKKKIIAAVTAAGILSAAVSASAAEVVTFTGRVNKTNGTRWITAMTLKSGADVFSPAFTDIGWINQVSVDDNGRYSISVPLAQLNGEYELRGNTEIKNYVYVSEQNGASDGDGSEESPVSTISEALAIAGDDNVIVLKDIVTIPKNTQLKSDKSNITITGKDPVTNQITGGMNLLNTISMHIKFPVVLENMTLETLATESIDENANKIFACGYSVTFGEGLTMTNPIDVFGGNSINNTVENTDITIKSGTYRRIYGGGEMSPVTGNTNVTVYGMNSGYSAEDDDAAYYDSRILGGGRNSGADVGGDTNITFKGGTVAYIAGGGSVAAVGGNTHISISGGRIMNVYGGTVDKTTVHNGDSYITMNGGTAEALFGGSYISNFEGNTHITVSGGEILRRIYGGCYNDFDGSWKSDYYVKGTIGVVIGNGAHLVTGTGLSYGNKMNSGIFGGSRGASNHSDEEAVLAFVNGSYTDYGSLIGEQGSVFVSSLKSHHDYLVKAGIGGEVNITAGKNINIIPGKGKKANINGNGFFGGEYTLADTVTEIEFEDGITVDNYTPEATAAGADITAGVTVGEQYAMDGNEKIVAAVYDGEGRLKGTSLAELTESGNYNISVDFDNTGETYTICLYVWDMSGLKPLGNACRFTL